MTNRLAQTLLAAAALCTAASAAPAPKTAPTPSAAAPPQAAAALAADASNAFGFDLWHQLHARKGNLVVSPASISAALAMTYAGAKGSTASELAHALHVPDDASRVVPAWADLAAKLQDDKLPRTLRFANRLFGDKTVPFAPEFTRRLADGFHAPLETVDFGHDAEAARTRINGWIADATAQRIKDLFAPGSLTRSTRLVLANAVYFLGKWEQPFQHGQTAAAPWHLASGEAVQVPTMHGELSIGTAHAQGATIVELPYRGSSAAMYVLMPDAGGSLDKLEGSLDGTSFAALRAQLQRHPIALAMPRFELTPGAMDLIAPLGKLGVHHAFGTADLSPMTDGKETLKVDGIVHKAFVKVDEDGTEAAAATGVSIGATSVEAPATRIDLDRAFDFVIVDRATGAVLFLGRVADPRST